MTQPEKLPAPRWYDADFVADCAPNLPRTPIDAIAVFFYSGVTEVVSYDGYPDVQFSVAIDLAQQYFPAAFETKLLLPQPKSSANARRVAQARPLRHVVRHTNNVIR